MARKSKIELALERAVAEIAPVRVSYRPGIGAFETGSSADIIADNWRGEYQWPVRRDPIFTPIFTAILGPSGFGLFATGSTALTTAATIASAITTTAVTKGIQSR